MNMHHSDGVADWEQIPPEDWNPHQVRAAETNGWDTPGNRATVKGFISSVLGLVAIENGRPEAGLGLLTYGRWQDLNDGKESERTGTKSPKGEALDATADKLLMAAALPVLARNEIISMPESVGIFAQQGVSGISSLAAKSMGETLHPSKAGKYSMFAQWFSIGLGLASEIAEKYDQANLSEKFRKAQKGTMLAGLALGAVASVNYVQQVHKIHANKRQPILEQPK